MIDLTRYEGHTEGPWEWKVPRGWENAWYEGDLPSVVTQGGECVLDFGDCTQYYPTSGGYPGNEADRNLVADAPLLLAEIVSLRARNLSLIETGRKIVDDHTERTNECIRLRAELEDLKERNQNGPTTDPEV